MTNSPTALIADLIPGIDQVGRVSETETLYGHYELAERCPLLVLERRA